MKKKEEEVKVKEEREGESLYNELLINWFNTFQHFS